MAKEGERNGSGKKRTRKMEMMERKGRSQPRAKILATALDGDINYI